MFVSLLPTVIKTTFCFCCKNYAGQLFFKIRFQFFVLCITPSQTAVSELFQGENIFQEKHVVGHKPQLQAKGRVPTCAQGYWGVRIVVELVSP